MPGTVPAQPKLYHIVHVDRLASIAAEGGLVCDAEVVRNGRAGTTIGLDSIKQRRLLTKLSSHEQLTVGDCVPFYFCPRSVMLYVIARQNHPELLYRGGQNPIVHLELDLAHVVSWAQGESLRWAFTLSNAGSTYFEDRASLAHLHDVDWDAVQATQWAGSRQHGKQAEFLVEREVTWRLVERIGVRSRGVYQQVVEALQSGYAPNVEILPSWYY